MSIRILFTASLLTAWCARAGVVDFDDENVRVVTPQARGHMKPGGQAKWETKFELAHVELLVTTARGFFDEGNFDAALANLIRADADMPLNPMINLAICQTLGAKGAFDRAVVYANRAISYAPRQAAGYLMLGHCYLELKNYAQARTVYENLLDFDPGNHDAVSGLAHSLGELGEGKLALATYEKALRLQPKSAYLHEMFGHVQMGQGDAASALKSYEKARELDPKSSEILNSLGAAHFNLGQTNRAVEVYAEAIQADPQNPKLYRNLAAILTAAGNYGGAMDALLASINLDFNSPEAWQHMLRVYAHALREQEKGWSLPEAPAELATRAEKGRWHHAQGLARFKEGQIARAGQHWVAAILHDDTVAEYFNDFGTLVAAHLNKGFSVPFFRAAQMVDPTLASAAANLRQVLKLIDDEARARRLGEVAKAAAAQPEDAALQLELGRLYASLNQVTNAVPAFARAVTLAPTNSVARMDYAQALFLTGRADDALEQVRAAHRAAPEDPFPQYRLAWLLLQKGAALDEPGRKQALALLARSNLATRYLDPNQLFAWAQAYALDGRKHEAASLARMAARRADELALDDLAAQVRKEFSPPP